MVNNADWLMDLNYIDVLREVGAHFSVNRMLTAECYKQRMEKRIELLRIQLHDHAELRFFTHYTRNMAATCSSAVMTSGATCLAVPS